MKNKRNSTAKMQIACAIVFITFTYVYLAFYQADVLAVAQHVFSGRFDQLQLHAGSTAYHARTLSAASGSVRGNPCETPFPRAYLFPIVPHPDDDYRYSR